MSHECCRNRSVESLEENMIKEDVNMRIFLAALAMLLAVATAASAAAPFRLMTSSCTPSDLRCCAPTQRGGTSSPSGSGAPEWRP